MAKMIELHRVGSSTPIFIDPDYVVLVEPGNPRETTSNLVMATGPKEHVQGKADVIAGLLNAQK
jgi:hypothetical protein